jgi:hypothetical protein
MNFHDSSWYPFSRDFFLTSLQPEIKFLKRAPLFEVRHLAHSCPSGH